jgi:hypothetical protein
MGKSLLITPDHLEYLRSGVASGTPLTVMARHVGCCTDTLKRILMRHGLAFFDGAKYAVAVSSTYKMWTRPCLYCKDDSPRPKNQYICDKCHTAIENDQDL